MPYSGENIRDIPFFSVTGNHDYGRGAYVCNGYNESARCDSTDTMLQGLDNKFRWIADYTSPDNDRWSIDDHFYTRRYEDVASGVSVEISNLDMNDATVAGAHSICCRCYGYDQGDDSGCNSVQRGDKYCCGGDTDMYDACMARFVQRSAESRKLLVEYAFKSTATWKIASSHYSAIQHFPEEGMHKWLKALGDAGITEQLYGHVHGCKVELASNIRTYFVENGIGGDAKKEWASTTPAYATLFVKHLWAYEPVEYGVISLEASKNNSKLQYHTYDKDWNFTADKYEDVVVGGVATKYCLLIPKDGSSGKRC